MINYAPIPLLETSLFLANQATGMSWTSYMERIVGKGDNQPHNSTLASYSNILTELERRLRASITVSNKTVQTLFAPLHQRGKDQHYPSSGYVCSILTPSMVEAYVSWEETAFFSRLREHIQQVPKQILDFLDQDACNMAADCTIQQLFSKINNSDLPQNSKLILIDLALNPEGYIDMLQETMLPVVAEFKRCRELIAPLLEQFHARYSRETETAIMDRLWPGDRSRIRQVFIYPGVVCSNYVIFGFNADETVLLSSIGSVYEFLRENFAQARSSGIQLTKTLVALSNRNRFNILTKLLDGPAYGRELANFVGISPVTITQHIGILMGADLVSLHNDGTKTYYSLNTETLRTFIDSFQTYFQLN